MKGEMMYKLILALFLLVSALSAAPFSFADDYEHTMVIRTVSGKVNKVDWVGYSMIVRWFQPNGSYDDIGIKVTKKTKIIKAGEHLSFAAINVWDDVIVKYYDDPDDLGPLKALGITVTSH
jgi:hypothetical protein